MTTRYFRRLAKYPPCLIRLLARNPNGSAMSNGDLASRGCRHFFDYATTWEGIPIDQADAYLRACGADPLDTNWCRRVNRMTKPNSTAKMIWLQRSPMWPIFKDILKVYVTTL